MTRSSGLPWPQRRNGIARYGGAGFSFVASKAAVFLVPLLLSNLLERAQYGAFEYAYGVGSLAATVVALGVPAAIPAFLLQRRRPAYTKIFAVHIAGLGLALIPLGLLHATGFIGDVTFAAGVLTAAIAAQSILSSYCKTTGTPAYASLAESGVYLVILAVVGALSFTGHALKLSALSWGVQAYVMSLAFQTLRYSWPLPRPQHLLRRYRAVLVFGFPIVFSSFLMLAVTSSGRLLVGSFLGVSDVAIYSFFFRLAAPVVLIHQLVHTLFFPRLYVSETGHLDRYYSTIISFIAVTALAMFCVAPPVLSRFLALLSGYDRARALVYFSLSTQMVYWVVLALTEPIVYRNGLGPRLIWILCAHAAALVAVCAVASHLGALTLLRLCQMHLIVLFSAATSQLLLLWRNDVRLPRTLFACSCVALIHVLLLPFIWR